MKAIFLLRKGHAESKRNAIPLYFMLLGCEAGKLFIIQLGCPAFSANGIKCGSFYKSTCTERL